MHILLSGRVGGCQSRFLIQVELDCVNGLIGINRLVRNWVLSCKPVSDHAVLSIDNNGKSIYITRGSEIRMGAYTNGTMDLFELVSLCKHPIFCTWALRGMHLLKKRWHYTLIRSSKCSFRNKPDSKYKVFLVEIHFPCLCHIGRAVFLFFLCWGVSE